MKAVYLIIAALLVTTTACAGPEGPTGPTGAQGPAGPGAQILLTATIPSNGGVSLTLPAAAGTDMNNPPAMSCYITADPGSTVWLTLTSTLTTANATTCGLVFSGGVFAPTMHQCAARVYCGIRGHALLPNS